MEQFSDWLDGRGLSKISINLHNGNEIQPSLPVWVDNNFEFSVNLWNKENPIDSTRYLSKNSNCSTIPKEIGFIL